MQPLLHLWSLGVEEQFYLAWPLLLLLTKRSRLAMPAIVIGSFALSVWMLSYSAKDAFYLPFPRAWELALGGVVVLAPRLNLPSWAGATGLIGIAWGAFGLDGDSSFPGPNALAPTIGTALLIWLPFRPLGWKPFAFVGQISYSLYLWHWPVLVFFRHYANGSMPSGLEASGLAAISVLLATLSWRYVERPFRRTTLSPRKAVSIGVAGSIAVSLVGGSVVLARGAPSRLPASIADMQSLETMWTWPCKTINVGRLGEVCNFGSDWHNASERVLLWGDSHAAHMAPLFASIVDRNVSFVLYEKCPASMNMSVRVNVPGAPLYAQDCADSYKKAIDEIRLNTFDRIIITAYWSGHLPTLGATQIEQISATKAGLTRALDEIGPSRRVTVIGEMPNFLYDPVPCAIHDLATKALFRKKCALPALIMADEYRDRQLNRTYQALIEAVSSKTNVNLILPGTSLCNQTACMTSLDGLFLYRDQSHIRRNLPIETQRKLARMIRLQEAF